MHKMKSETPDYRKLSVGGWRLAEPGIDTNYKSLDRKKSGRNSRQQRNNSGQNNRLVLVFLSLFRRENYCGICYPCFIK